MRAIVVYDRNNNISYPLDIGATSDTDVLFIKNFLEEKVRKGTKVLVVYGLESYGEYEYDKLFTNKSELIKILTEKEIIKPT